MAGDLRALALLVCRLGCAHQAAGACGVTAVAEPMGLSLDRPTTVRSRESAPRHHHRRVASPSLLGAGPKSVPSSLPGDFSLTSVAGPYMSGPERAQEAWAMARL